MSVPPRQETATIYQFPVRHRPPLAVDRVPPRPPTSASPSVIASDFGSGWYHEAAMQEPPQGCKH